MKSVVGVTTAQRRADYLTRTLASLRAAGWERPTVFAEPGSNVPSNPAVCRVVIREWTLGIFHNWRQSLIDLLDESADAVLLCQDDVVFCRKVRDRIEHDLWPTPRTGCVSVYCGSLRATGRGMTRIDEMNIWGACALVFPRSVAERLLNHRVTRTWGSSRKVDVLVGTVLRALKLEMWAYTPSLAQHIGLLSTQAGWGNATEKRMACDFVGEDFDASAGDRQFCGTVAESSPPAFVTPPPPGCG